jgi:tRNA (guanine37-N1)-methyltransferase
MSVNLKKYLQDILSSAELDLLVQSYDVIGDIAVIIIPEVLEYREKVIGEAILANNPKLRVVVKREGLYSGEFRTIHLHVIAGEDRKETEHREYGVRLLVNPETVYFSVRSGTERKRIATLVEQGEDVLILFSGIGPYPLVIAANSQANRVVGIEKNPEAHRYGLKNLARNRKIENVQLLQGDVRDVLPGLDLRFDRIVMPLPKDGEEFLPYALNVLKPYGMLHYYEMQHVDAFDDSIAKVRRACMACGRRLVSASIVKAGHCGPRTYRVCVDGRVD